MTDQPFITPAILIILFGIPLALGIIPRNRFYGVRTRKTLSEDAVWYPANRFGGWAFILTGLVYLTVAALKPYHGGKTADFRVWVLHLVAFGVPLVVSFVAIFRRIRRLP